MQVMGQEAMGQDISSFKPRIQFSIITCAAGEDIYTIWGHTAVRVVDSVNQTDIVFNYGTFNFNEPNFITKFLKGDLLYFVSVNNYSDFLKEYQFEKRNVYEQVLKITAAEKIKWYTALQVNMIGDNRFYLYNFISDNCTTRVKDGLFKNSGFQPTALPISSYRSEVVSAPYKQGLPWIGLGIDLLLGAYADQKPSDFQAAFLPFLLHQQVATTGRLVLKENILTYASETNTSTGSPFYILFVFLIVYSFSSKWNSLITQRLAKVLDVLLLISFTAGGSLMVYMSMVSKHTACYQNYNLMWMHPLYIIALIFYFIPSKAIGQIGFLFFASIVGLVLTSYWLPQHFSKEVWVLIATAALLNYRLVEKGRINALFKK
ncbi:MAG: DUF4105 domain-containing protein [Sediminibacterium sp.]|nr:MAG: DUF4105 domain-containing protein [Sediminibacterium sp.]